MSSQAAGMLPHERVAYRSFVARSQITRNEGHISMDGVVNARSLNIPEPSSSGIGIEFQVSL
jgi:hypothetical protein